LKAQVKNKSVRIQLIHILLCYRLEDRGSIHVNTRIFISPPRLDTLGTSSLLFSLQGGMEETFCGKCHEDDL